MQNYHEILLPVTDNAGRYTSHARKQWEEEALRICGGFTRGANVEGAWRDPETGKVYREPMVPYRLMCCAVDFYLLRNVAFYYFPDQLTIFMASIGEAEIRRRTDHATTECGT